MKKSLEEINKIKEEINKLESKLRIKENYDTIARLEDELFKYSDIPAMIETLTYVIMRLNITDFNGKYKNIIDILNKAIDLSKKIQKK